MGSVLCARRGRGAGSGESIGCDCEVLLGSVWSRCFRTGCLGRGRSVDGSNGGGGWPVDTGEGWVAEAGAGAEAEAGTGVGAGCLLAEREGGPESASESLLDGLGRGTVNIEAYVSKKSTKKTK